MVPSLILALGASILNREDVIAYLNEEIDSLTRTRDYLSGSGSPTAPTDEPKRSAAAGTGKRTFSAESRGKMAAAQRRRWAARKAQAAPVAASPAVSPVSGAVRGGKRAVSAAARAKMAAAQQRRWAIFRKKKAGK